MTRREHSKTMHHHGHHHDHGHHQKPKEQHDLPREQCGERPPRAVIHLRDFVDETTLRTIAPTEELRRHHWAKCMPAMTPRKFRALVDSIRRHRQRHPVVLYRGEILDGWHRWLACQKLGIECLVVEFCGTFELARDYVLDDFVRKAPTKDQSALVAATFVPELKPEARRRMAQGGKHKGKGVSGLTPLRQRWSAVDEAGLRCGVSRHLVYMALKLLRQAPEIADLVRLGRLRLRWALRLAQHVRTERDHFVAQHAKEEDLNQAIKDQFGSADDRRPAKAGATHSATDDDSSASEDEGAGSRTRTADEPESKSPENPAAKLARLQQRCAAALDQAITLLDQITPVAQSVEPRRAPALITARAHVRAARRLVLAGPDPAPKKNGASNHKDVN